MMRDMTRVLDIDQLAAEYDDVYGDADRAEWDDVMTHNREGYWI